MTSVKLQNHIEGESVPCLYSGQQRLVARVLSPPRLCVDHTHLCVSFVVRWKRNRALLLADQSATLCCRPTSRVRDGEECEDGTKHDRRRARTLHRTPVLLQRVAGIVLVVAYRRRDEVCAVDCDHARLREPGARVVLLHCRVDARDGDDDAQREVHRDEEAVECAAGAGEEPVQQSRKCDARGVHGRGGADENPLPEIRARVFPVFQAGFGPRVREVD